MQRSKVMALGFFLIFVGIQLNVVERYVMTPRTANLLSATGTAASTLNPPADYSLPANTAYNSPYYQASYQTPATTSSYLPASRELRPPRWLCWPVLFLGAVILISGITSRRV